MRLPILVVGSVGLLAACSDRASVYTPGADAGGQTSIHSGGSGGAAQQSTSSTTGGTSAGFTVTSGGTSNATGGTNFVTGGMATTIGGSGPGTGTSEVGGKSSSGGSSSTAGQTRTGGTSSTGGSRATGGTPGTGGTLSAGGTTNAGGAVTGGVSAGGVGGTAPACTDQRGSLKPTYPFPQNFRSTKCTYPKSACSSDARAVYDQWKRELVVDAGPYQRVIRPDQEAGLVNSTVSEGIGYGMILAVFMDDQTLLDNLWQYSQQHLNDKKLMIWLIDSSGNPGNESSGMPASGSASDADEDIAWALALAAQKWGTSAALGSYKTLAVDMIGRVYSNEADTRYDMLNAGDSWGTTFAWNPSYFAPYEYRLFAQLDTAHADGWKRIIDKGYQALAASQNASGLVPAWTDASGNPAAAWSGGPTHYQYDAARVPFRIGIDYCEYGETRAVPILQKFTTFFAGIGAAGIVDGYALDGTPQPEHTTPSGVQSALFVGAAGVGAMSTTNSAFVDGVYARLVTQPDSLMMPVSVYYNHSWKVFTLLMMSGNLFDYTLHT
jgi:endo-1,4-beta-D-glucanase Y